MQAISDLHGFGTRSQKRAGLVKCRCHNDGLNRISFRQDQGPLKKFPSRRWVQLSLVGWLTVAGSFSFALPCPPPPNQEATALPAENPGWRSTALGWQASAKRRFPDKVRYERSIELIHPLVLTLLILFASLAALFWSAEEWEFVRLVQGSATARRPMSPRCPGIADYGDTDLTA